MTSSDADTPERRLTRLVMGCSEHHNTCTFRPACRELCDENSKSFTIGYSFIIGVLTLLKSTVIHDEAHDSRESTDFSEVED